MKLPTLLAALFAASYVSATPINYVAYPLTSEPSDNYPGMADFNVEYDAEKGVVNSAYVRAWSKSPFVVSTTPFLEEIVTDPFAIQTGGLVWTVTGQDFTAYIAWDREPQFEQYGKIPNYGIEVTVDYHATGFQTTRSAVATAHFVSAPPIAALLGFGLLMLRRRLG